ncbi:hypothetical protein CLOM_g13321 [Closterium sp. NIES-68]|nr:hypothetical protein CLOM_g23944 [Closterium sp. NIES-68]GJP54223.1 hypothetical protein CLOM_g13321 [Closterium sp. NIES-68]GJP83961.1 hypothetical protein CLOP_g14060 [Closterium sp. NIES-67]
MAGSDELMDVVNALREEVSSTKRELALTKEELVATKGELAAIKGELAEMKILRILRDINCTSDDPDLHFRNVYLLNSIVDHFGIMTHLKWIDLEGSTGFGPGIQHLFRLPRLEKLNLGETDIQDNGLEGIDAAGSLEYLSLSGTDVSAAGLRHLSSLSSLRTLELDSCWLVTSAGMFCLRKLTGLESLHLGGTAVKDDGLKYLTSLTKLKELGLPAGITDAGMEHVKHLTALEQLDLRDCRLVTQTGVECLKSLPRLR